MRAARRFETRQTGAIRLPIERVALDRIAEAWRLQAGGPHTKIVVVP